MTRDDLQVDVLTSFDALADLESSWHELFDASPSVRVSQSPEWIGSWYRRYESAHGVYVVVVRRDRELVGLAPFSRSGTRWKGGPQFLVSASVELNDNTVGGDPLIRDDDPAVAASIATHLAAEVRRGLTVVHARGLRRAGPFQIALEQCPGLALAQPKGFVSPIVVLGTPESTDALERRVRQHRLPRRRRRLEERFSSVAFDPDDRDVVGVLRDMETLLDGRWPPGEGPSLFTDEARRRFTVDVWSTLVEQGNAHFVVLRLDGRRAAVQLVSHVGAHHACEVIAYDAELREFALGHLVMAEALRIAGEQGAATVDLGAPRSDYKDGWADDAVEWTSTTLARPGRGGQAALKLRKLVANRRRRRLGRTADEPVRGRF